MNNAYFVDSDDEDAKFDLPIYTLHVTEARGDLFDAPDNTVLAHACNCMGDWGAGIAAVFKRKYPKAYLIYKNKCNTTSMIGKCLLIPPQEADGLKHYIACLFTSRKYGRFKDSKELIIYNTKTAVNDMLSQVDNTYEIRMPKINSKNFGVPWSDTSNMLSRIQTSHQRNINIVDLI